MKKNIALLTLITLLAITSCSNEKSKVKKETIVQPQTAPEKNTTITVDKNGVRVETKKVDVTINPDKKKDN